MYTALNQSRSYLWDVGLYLQSTPEYRDSIKSGNKFIILFGCLQSFISTSSAWSLKETSTMFDCRDVFFSLEAADHAADTETWRIKYIKSLFQTSVRRRRLHSQPKKSAEGKKTYRHLRTEKSRLRKVSAGTTSAHICLLFVWGNTTRVHATGPDLTHPYISAWLLNGLSL